MRTSAQWEYQGKIRQGTIDHRLNHTFFTGPRRTNHIAPWITASDLELEVLELNWILDLLQSKNYLLAAWLHNLTRYDQNSSKYGHSIGSISIIVS